VVYGMDMSDEILKLVRTVAGLPREDQSRILRLVDLLSLAPYSVQQRTQGMLRKLLDADPRSKHQCVANVDELIAYLEQSVAESENRGTKWADYHDPFVRGTTQ